MQRSGALRYGFWIWVRLSNLVNGLLAIKVLYDHGYNATVVDVLLIAAMLFIISGLLRECHSENPLRVDTLLLYEPCDTAREYRRLAGARASQHAGRLKRRGNSFYLLGVQPIQKIIHTIFTPNPWCPPYRFVLDCFLLWKKHNGEGKTEALPFLSLFL